VGRRCYPTGFVQSAHQLHIARFALGLAEAGYFPGIVLYLAFRRRQMVWELVVLLLSYWATTIPAGSRATGK
jgi:ACS family tartrate transporter-like MFS transporter